MSRPLRYQPEEWSIFFVTGRCIQSRFLLRPSPRVNALIVGVLARALERFDIRLFGMCFLSNHYHLLLSSKNAASLASFMQYVGSNIAREIGRQHRWKEKFWSRRYTASMVLDEAAQIDRMKYILSNSVKEGLVKHPRYWPGVHCYRNLAEGTPLHGIWINRTSQHVHSAVTEKQATTKLTLNLAQLPFYETLSTYEYRAAMRALAKEAVEDSQAESQSQYLGQKRILNVDPHSSPKSTDKSPAPLCHSGCPRKYRAFVESFREFVSDYKHAYDRIVEGLLSVELPHGSLPPTGWSVSFSSG